MDQNNIYDQNVNNGNQEPLPSFDQQPQQAPQYAPQPPYGYDQQAPQYAPQPQYGYGQQPPQYIPQVPQGYNQPAPAASNPAVEASANSAFGKSLASVILAEFPICSIIAIFLAAAGLHGVSATSDLATRLGVRAGGKNIAARVLGIVGLSLSIFMTVFWFFYFVIIVGVMSAF